MMFSSTVTFQYYLKIHKWIKSKKSCVFFSYFYPLLLLKILCPVISILSESFLFVKAHAHSHAPATHTHTHSHALTPTHAQFSQSSSFMLMYSFGLGESSHFRQIFSPTVEAIKAKKFPFFYIHSFPPPPPPTIRHPYIKNGMRESCFVVGTCEIVI